MGEIIAKLPLWYIMVITGVIVGAVIYRLVKYGIKIKAGSIEIDADNVDSGEEGKK